MSDKTLYIHHERTFVTSTWTIFRKGLVLLTLRKQKYYHRIKDIIFKSSSSKYNEASHYYLDLIKELPVYGNISLGPAQWPTLYKHSSKQKSSRQSSTLRSAVFASRWIWSGVSWSPYQSVEAVWHGFREASIHVGCSKTGILEPQSPIPQALTFCSRTHLKRPCATLVQLVGRKTNPAAGLSESGGVVSVSSPSSMVSASSPPNQAAGRMCCLRPYHQPKQKTWNPTNYSCGPSTDNQIP